MEALRLDTKALAAEVPELYAFHSDFSKGSFNTFGLSSSYQDSICLKDRKSFKRALEMAYNMESVKYGQFIQLFSKQERVKEWDKIRKAKNAISITLKTQELNECWVFKLSEAIDKLGIELWASSNAIERDYFVLHRVPQRAIKNIHSFRELQTPPPSLVPWKTLDRFAPGQCWVDLEKAYHSLQLSAAELAHSLCPTEPEGGKVEDGSNWLDCSDMDKDDSDSMPVFFPNDVFERLSAQQGTIPLLQLFLSVAKDNKIKKFIPWQRTIGEEAIRALTISAEELEYQLNSERDVTLKTLSIRDDSWYALRERLLSLSTKLGKLRTEVIQIG